MSMSMSGERLFTISVRTLEGPLVVSSYGPSTKRFKAAPPDYAGAMASGLVLTLLMNFGGFSRILEVLRVVSIVDH